MKSEWRALILVAAGLALFQSCGAWQKLNRASLEVKSQGGKAPLKTADAVPLPPLDPSAITDTSPGVQTPDTPPTAPTEPELLPPTLTTATGPVVGSTEVTLELGTKRDWVKIQIRREPGGSPPGCLDGVVVGEYNEQSVNPVTFTDHTGSAGQTYSYTACLQDRDGSVLEVSATASASSKPQIMFTTAPTVRGNLGGSAKAADELCSQFAHRSPRIHLRREEHWRAVLSDDQVAARSRVRILGQIAASDYSLTNSFHTLFRDGDLFWSSGLSESSGPILDATGNPTQSPVWTGSNSDGTIQSGLTCSNWTSSLADEFGQTGDASTLTGMGWISGGGPGGCDLQRSLYCIAEPRPLVEARPSNGAEGGIELTITPPVGSFGRAHIAVRRRAAAAGLPSLSCDSPFDTPISTISQLNAPKITIKDDLTAANVAYHYSACLIDEFGHLIFSTRDVYTIASQPTSP